MKRQPAVTAATRQKLIDAFWDLLEKKDLNSITIREITNLADYNRGTFYQYFTDIYALAESEEERILAAIRKMNAPKVAMEDPEMFSRTVLPFLEQNRQQIVLLLAKRNEAFLGKIKMEMYPFFLDSFHIRDTATARIMFSFVIGGITQALIEWQTNQPDLTIEQIAPFIVNSLLQGPVTMLKNLEEQTHD